MTDNNIRAAIKEVVDGYCDNTDLMVDDLVGVVQDALEDVCKKCAHITEMGKEIARLRAENERMRGVVSESEIIAREWGGFEHNRVMNKAVERLWEKLSALKEKP